MTAQNAVSGGTERSAAAFESATFSKIARRIVPLLFAGYFVAFLDRVNVGFAKLQMAGDLHYSDAVYGFGAGLGWMLAIVLLAGIRERLKKSQIPPALEGPGIALIITGIMALAFIGFSGMIQQ